MALGLLSAWIGGFLLPLLACGPFFPNSLLLTGDSAVLDAPGVRFRAELERLQLPAPPRLVHVPTPEDDPRQGTVGAEISDLRHALAGGGMPSEEAARVVLEYSRRRADLEDHRVELRQWRWERENRSRQSGTLEEPGPRPAFTLGGLPAGLPREFELYLLGAAAWQDGRTNEARAAWESVLALPPAARPFKSTWAAFMLARSWHDDDPEKADAFYERVVRLARDQFADSAGLGVSALGWQGQLRLRSRDFKGALGLYLDQYAAGSTQSSALSLTVAARALTEQATQEQRVEAARDPVFRRVVTAWLLSEHTGEEGPKEDAVVSGRTPRREESWLGALEAVGAAEVPLAEQLAVLGYQTGNWEEARRWIELAGDSPVAAWIGAKLQLRDGRLKEAAEALAQVVERLPLDPPERLPGQPPDFIDSLVSTPFEYYSASGRRQLLGELGVLRLSRGEFVMALDALLRAGFWSDAAYVAERVLTVDELRGYVDQHWAPVERRTASTSGDDEPDAGARERIRHLLGRRLTRVHRGGEATPYFPRAMQELQARFIGSLRGGEDTIRPPRDRARDWMAAAWQARTNGLDLLGTELAPDGFLFDGQYEAGPEVSLRETLKARVARPTGAELSRAKSHDPEPNERFHYRYQAASLAWQAASLLPNHDPETAQALYHGGSWLMYRDPKTADVFYKALVRRCRKTELGQAADLQRWFPPLDADGKPRVTRALPGSLPTSVEPPPSGEANPPGSPADPDPETESVEPEDGGDPEDPASPPLE